MSVATILENFLSSRGITYEVISHTPTASLEQAADQLGIATSEFARAIVLRVDGQARMAVLPLSHVLNFSALARLLGGEPQPVPAEELASTFADCESGCIPALGDAYGVSTVYDEALFEPEAVVFEGGSHVSLVRMTREGLRSLIEPAAIGRFSRSVDSLQEDKGANLGPCPAPASGAPSNCIGSYTPAAAIKDRIEAIYELPMMPEHARRILELNHDPNADASDLARVVDLDPSLAAQVMRYARSPLFSYGGKITDLEQAISRVLGFDLVMNLAVGLAALKPFRNPPDGPLGLHAFWRHATYSAALAQRVGRQLPPRLRPKPGPLHLAGLLHNFGYLAFGHLFQPEFYLLNKMVAANPRVPVTTLERQVLCMGQARDVLCLGHAEVGAWLLKSWNMPEEVVAAACEHHNEDYAGVHAGYANLVLLVDRLLKRYGIGDADCDVLPSPVLQRLGLTAEGVEAAAAELFEGSDGVEDMIGQWVA